MLRCAICHRPLIRCAVPGLAIGPTCAKRRGLMPDRRPRIRQIEVARVEHSAQVDWIKALTTGQSANYQQGY